MTRSIARVLAVAAVVWCVGIGVWLWVTPVPYNGSMSTAYADASGVVQHATYELKGTQSFAERSALGPVPLLIPVVIAALGAWAVWRTRLLAAAIAAGILLVFVILASFSIGAGYAPAAAGLIWAAVALSDR